MCQQRRKFGVEGDIGADALRQGGGGRGGAAVDGDDLEAFGQGEQCGHVGVLGENAGADQGDANLDGQNLSCYNCLSFRGFVRMAEGVACRVTTRNTEHAT